MIYRAVLALILVLLIAFSAPAFCKTDTSADFRLIDVGDALQLRSDRAYVLLRIDTSLDRFSAVLLRIPAQAEIDAFEQVIHTADGGLRSKKASVYYHGRTNLYELSSLKASEKIGKIVTVVAEVPPADYVFYGEGARGSLKECMCLGTVGFSASAGQITDIGTMFTAYAAKPSVIPELQGEVDLGPSAMMEFAMFAVALRPQRDGDTIPTGIDVSKVKPARFHAVGPFVDPNVWTINRLAPIPGVLRYEAGRVFDVATGREELGN